MTGAPRDGQADHVSAGEAMLGTVLDASVHLRPDDVPALLAESATQCGLRDLRVYLVDKRQLLLVPFPRSGAETLEVDGTAAGKAFQKSQVVTVAGDPDDQLWFPLLDGSDRVGVIGARGDSSDALLLTRGRRLASLGAEVLVAKSAYGDNIVSAARQRDIALAAEMRWALMPPLTFVGPDFSLAGYVEPAYEIAGDAFDYAINGDTAHLAIFDAVGHDLTASRIANLAILSYRHSRRAGHDLPATYQAMTATIASCFHGQEFVTAQLATLDLAGGVLHWVTAGHPAPVLLRSGHPARELTGEPALPVGIGDVVPVVQELALQPGDVLALYSDGIPDARSPDGVRFGTERLAEFLRRAVDEHENPPEIVRRLVHSIVEHQGGDPGDDATILLVIWHGPGNG